MLLHLIPTLFLLLTQAAKFTPVELTGLPMTVLTNDKHLGGQIASAVYSSMRLGDIFGSGSNIAEQLQERCGEHGRFSDGEMTISSPEVNVRITQTFKVSMGRKVHYQVRMKASYHSDMSNYQIDELTVDKLS